MGFGRSEPAAEGAYEVIEMVLTSVQMETECTALLLRACCACAKVVAESERKPRCVEKSITGAGEL
jgi:hypothetical protein